MRYFTFLFKLLFSFLLFICLSAGVALAQTTLAVGNWNVGATWVGGVVPIAGADVTIAHNVTVPNAYTTPALNTVTINTARTLTNSGTIIAQNITGIGTAALTNSGTIIAQNITGSGTAALTNAANGTIEVRGDGVYFSGLALNFTAIPNTIHYSNVGGTNNVMALTNYNNVALSNNGYKVLPNGSINVTGNWIESGVTGRNVTNSTVNFTGTTNATIGGSFSFLNVGINKTGGSKVTLNSSGLGGGTLTLTSGMVDNTIGSFVSFDGYIGGSATNYIQMLLGAGGVTRGSVPTATNITLPIGTATTYNPITFQTSTAGLPSISVRLSSPSSSPTTSANLNLQWDFQSSIAATAISSATINWVATNVTGTIAGANSQFQVSGWASVGGTATATSVSIAIPITIPNVGYRGLTAFKSLDFYSIGNAFWNVLGNWSYTSFGTDCNCSPRGIANANVRVGIGNTATAITAGHIGTSNVISVQNTGVLDLQSGNTNAITTLTTVAGSTVKVGGTLNLASPATTTINGTLLSEISGIAPNGMTFANGSTYAHARDWGAIPTATWGATSTVNITGITNTVLTGLGQTFGNFTWNNAGQAVQQTLDGNMTVAGDMNITNANTSNFSLGVGTLGIDLKRNFTNSNATFFNGGTGTGSVTFSGVAAQTITGTTTFRNVVINNTAATPTVTLAAPVTISNNLTLTNGRIALGVNNLSYAGATPTIVRTNGWIQTNGTGTFIRTAAGAAYTFPVGDATALRLVTLANTTAGTNSVRFITPISPAVTGSLPAGGMWAIASPTSTNITFTGVGGTATNTGIIYKDVVALWTQQPTGGTFPSFTTTVAQTSGNFTVFTPAATYYSIAAGGNWNNAATWSTVCGGAGGAGVPTAADDVVICGATVTNDAASACNNLTVSAGGTLQLSNQNLTINGNTVNNGTINDNITGGTTIFNGTLANSGTFTNVNTSNSIFRFRGNITNNGTSPVFNLAGSPQYIFENNPVQIRNDAANNANITFAQTGSGTCTVSSSVTILNGTSTGQVQFFSNAGTNIASGVTLLNQNQTGSFLTGLLLGVNGTFTNDTNAKATYASSSTPSVTNFNVNSSGNSFSYTTNIGAVKAATYHHVSFGASPATLGGAITVNGNLTIGSGVTLDVSASNYGITMAGTIAATAFANNGTFIAQSGLVTFSGTAAQNLGGSNATTFNNVIINNTNHVTLNGGNPTFANVTFTAGSILMNTRNVTLTGTATGASAATGYFVTDGTGRLQQTTDTAKDFFVGNSTTLYTPVRINPSANLGITGVRVRLVALTPTIPINSGNILHAAEITPTTSANAVVTMNWQSNAVAYNSTGAPLTNTGIFYNNGAGTINQDRTGSSTALSATSTATSLPVATSSFAVYNALQTKTASATGNWNTAATWTPVGVPVVGDNVIITGAGITVTVDVAGINVSSVSIDNGATFDIGTFTPTIATLNSNGQQVNTFGMSTAAGASNINNATNFTNAFVTNNTRVMFAGSAYTIPANFGTVVNNAPNYPDVWFNHSSGTISLPDANLSTKNMILNNAGTMTVGSAATGGKTLTIGGDLQIKTGTTLSLFGVGYSVINLANNLIVDGTFNVSALTTGFNFTGITAATISGTTFPLSFNGANVSIAAGKTVTNNNNNVVIGGVLNGLNATSKWEQGTSSSLGYSNSTAPMATGILDATTNLNTVIYNNGAAQTIKNTNYWNLTFTNGGTKTIAGASPLISLKGNWLTNPAGVTIAPGTSTVTFNGTTAQTIGGASPSAFNNLSISNTSAGGVDIGTSTVTGTGTLNLAANATLKVGGANNFPSGFATYSLNTASTTEYYALANQNIFATTYGNLTLSGSGDKIILGDFTVGGNLGVVGAGTNFVFGATLRNVTVNGNVSGAGAIDLRNSAHQLVLNGANSTIGVLATDAANSAVFYNGAINQQVFASLNYTNLRVGTSGIKTIQGNVKANVLDFTVSGSAKIALGTFDITLPNLSSITNFSNAKYIVTNGIGKLNADYSGAALTAPIGISATSYDPVLLNASLPNDTYTFRAASPGTNGMQNISGAAYANAVWEIAAGSTRNFTTSTITFSWTNTTGTLTGAGLRTGTGFPLPDLGTWSAGNTISNTNNTITVSPTLSQFAVLTPLSGTTYYSCGTGNWNNAANWSTSSSSCVGGVVPIGINNAVIQSGHIVTATAAVADFNSLTVQNGATLDFATFAPANIPSISGNGKMRFSTATLPTVTTDGFTTQTGATIEFYGNTNYTIPTNPFNAGSNYPNLEISAGTNTISLPGGGPNCLVQQDFKINTGSFDVNGIIFTVNGATTINPSGSAPFVNFVDTNAGGTNTFNGLFTVGANGSINTSVLSPFNFGGGITNNGTCSISTNNINFTANQALNSTTSISLAASVNVGTFTVTNGSSGTTIINGNLIGTGTWLQGAGVTLVYGGLADIACTLDANTNPNTVNYTVVGIQPIKATTYHNIIFNATPNTLTGNITVNNNLFINTSLDVTASNHNIDIKGNWRNNNTITDFNGRNGLVTFSGTAPQTIIGNTNFYNLTINNTAGVTLSNSPASSTAASGTLTLTSGILDLGTVANDLTLNNGTVASQIAGTPSNTSHIKTTTGTGNLVRVGAGTNVDFPIGDGTNLRNVRFFATTGTNSARFTTSISPPISGTLPAAGMWVLGIPSATNLTFSNVGGTADATSKVYKNNSGWALQATTGFPNYNTTAPQTSGNFTIFSSPTTFYSRTAGTGTWADVTGTWSTVAINGADCACSPAGVDNATVTIKHNITVNNISDFGVANSIDIQDGGNLSLNVLPSNSINVLDGTGNTTGGVITMNMSSGAAFPTVTTNNFANNNLNTVRLSGLAGIYSGVSVSNFTGAAGNLPKLEVTANSSINANLSLDLNINGAVNIGVATLLLGDFTANRVINFNANTDIASGGGLTVLTTGAAPTNTINLAAGATLTNNGTFTLTNAGAIANINGTFNNLGTITLAATPSLNFPLSTSVYNHQMNGGSVPTATWNATSLCLITGMTSSVPLGLNQTFGNFTWNCAGQTAGFNLFSPTIKGDLTLQNSNLMAAGFTTVVLEGNLVNNIGAFFRPSAGTLTFTGTNAQTLTGNTGFDNLVINKSANDLTLNNNITDVSNSLTLTNGRVVLGTNSLTYTATANPTVGTGWIETDGIGAFIRTAAGTNFIFPVGDATNYQPLQIATPNNPSLVRFGTPTLAVPNAGAGSWFVNNGMTTSAITLLNPQGGILISGTSQVALYNTAWTSQTTTWPVANEYTSNIAFLGATEVGVFSCPAITIDGTALPNGTNGSVYTAENRAITGGTAPYIVAVTTGALPAGTTATILANDVVISGTPTDPGTFNFDLTVTDNNTCVSTAQSYTWVIDCPAITIDGTALPNGTNGSVYTAENRAITGGTALYAVAVTTGVLPAGTTATTLANDVVISGTPTVNGTFNFDLTVTDANTCASTVQSYNWVIDAAVINVSMADIIAVNIAGNIFKANGQRIYAMNISASGVGTTLTDVTTQLTIGTYTAADISNFQLYYNTVDNFATATSIGTSGAATGAGEVISFAELSQIITGGGIPQYLYIAANVNAGATTSNTISIPFLNAVTNFTFSTAVSASGSLGGSGVKTITTLAYYSIANGDWNVGTTWSNTSGGASCACTPAAGTDVFIEGGFTVTTTTNADVNNGNVSINSIGSTLDLGTTTGHSISGALGSTGNGTLKLASGTLPFIMINTFAGAAGTTVEYSGAGSYTIPAQFSGTDYTNLTISGGGVGALLGTTTITGTLTLTNGRVQLGASDLILSNATVANQIAGSPYTNSWIETNGTGLLIRQGAGANIDFPVGDPTAVRLVNLSATAAGNNTARFTTTVAPIITGTLPAAGMWVINTTGTTDLTFSNVGGTADATSKIHNGGWAALATTGGLPPYVATGEVFSGTDQNYTIFTPSTNAFITTWQTTTANESITIPTTGGGYSYTVDWGDFSIPTAETGNATHTYTTAGTYTVSISGAFPRIFFNNVGDRTKIRTIQQWGSQVWTSMNAAFYGCSNLTYTATDAPILTGVNDMSLMFYQATAFNGNIGAWNTAAVTDMSAMFFQATAFNQNIGAWNTAAVTNMQSMFLQATAFNQNIGAWNTSAVTNMNGMFYEATAFNQNIGAWITSAVTDMSFMFYQAPAFNQDIGTWNTSAVTNMSFMFRQAPAFNQNIGAWNTAAVTDMQSMFVGATAFNQSLATWTVGNVTTMASMLNNSGLSIANYDATLIGWAAQTLQTGVNLGAASLQYCTAVAARAILTTSPKLWVITDAGLGCAATFYSVVASGAWNDAASWSTVCGGTGGAGVPTAVDNVVICAGNTISLTAAAACNNLTIDAIGTLLATNGFNLAAKGTWSGGSSLATIANVTGLGGITFSGVVPQSIFGYTNFNNLIINNTNAATPTVTIANAPTTVTGTLTLTTGRLQLGANDLTLSNATVASQIAGSPYTTSWIETNGTGLLIRQGATTGLDLPVGDATGVRLVSMIISGAGNNAARFSPTIAPAIGGGTNPAAGMWIISRATGSTALTFSNVGGTADATSKIHNGGWTALVTTGGLPPYAASVPFTGVSQNFTVFTPSLVIAPTIQSSNILFNSLGSNSIGLQWTSGNGANRIVVASTSSSLLSPTNGVSYTVGQTLGTGIVVYNSSGSITLAVGLAPQTKYYFHVFDYNGTGTGTVYNPSSATNNPNNISTLATVPPNQPTGLVVTNLTPDSFGGTFTPAVPNSSGYLVVIRLPTDNPTLPTDGTEYPKGTTFFSGQVVISSGSVISFTASNLQPATEYIIEIYAYNGSGETTVYKKDKPLSIRFTTPALGPVLTSLDISEKEVGQDGFILFATGRNFIKTTVLKWQGRELKTTFISGTSLSAEIPKDLLLDAGFYNITASTPLPGGGESNARPFEVIRVANINAVPLISKIVAPDKNDHLLYRLEIAAIGGELSLKEIKLQTTGTYQLSDLKNAAFSLKYSTDENLDNKDITFATSSAVVSGGNITFNFEKTIPIPTLPKNKLSYLLLTVNIAKDAKVGNEIGIRSIDFDNIQFMERTNKKGKNPTLAGVNQKIISVTPTIQDYSALIKFFEAMGGKDWTVSWNLNSPVNTWRGVELDEEGRVIAVSLPENNLIGKISDALTSDGVLIGTNLRYLNLSGNKIKGPISANLGNLINLEYLDLSDNELSGTVSNDLAKLTNLVTLWLGYNQFTNIDIDFSAMTNLRNLFLQFNNFEKLPENIGDLTNLEVLNLKGNNFKILPQSFGKLRKLKYLDISDNDLEQVPVSISTLTELEGLLMHSNLFKTIPNELINLKKLNLFTVYDNRLEFGSLEPLRQWWSSQSKIDISYFPQSKIGSPQEIAAQVGSPITLSVPTTGTENKYKWLKNGIAIAGGTNANLILQNISTQDVGIYTLEVTNPLVPKLTLQSHNISLSVDCSKATNISKPKISVEGSSIFCAGESVSTRLTIVQSADIKSYKWFVNGVEIANSNVSGTNSILANNMGRYATQVTFQNGCSLFTDEVVISILPEFAVTITQSQGVLQASMVASREMSGYEWFLNDRIIENATQRTFAPIERGSYKVRATDKNGCRSISKAETISAVTAVEDNIYEGEIKVYPNPSNAIFYVEIGKEKAKKVQLFNALGQYFNESIDELGNGKFLINLDKSAVGIYFIEIHTEKGKIVRRLFKE